MIRPYFDAHCDTAFEWWRQKKHIDDGEFHISSERMKHLPAYAQFFALCTVWQKDMPPEAQYENAMAYFFRELKNQPSLKQCGSADEVRSAWSEGKCACILSIEGAEAISCDPGKLESAMRSGVRMVSLTWNEDNALAGCNLGDGGLTAQGREFVRRCQRLGILVDVSHCSEQAFFDICEIAEKPIAASHSNCRALCRHPRNLTDDQLRVLFQLGGFVGLNFYPIFLREDGSAEIDDICRHYEHICELGGIDHVGFGADWDGVEMLPKGIGGIDDVTKIIERLTELGAPDAAIANLSSATILRVMQECGTRPVTGV